VALSKPVVVYEAEHNIEAGLICEYLERNGIESHATLEESVVGLWAFGRLPGIHRPRIWVDEPLAESAKSLLAKYEAERLRRQGRSGDDDAATIEVVCEDCGASSAFPASQRGSVQDCKHCGAYVDVGADDSGDDRMADSDS
jgi:hypothetical protein